MAKSPFEGRIIRKSTLMFRTILKQRMKNTDSEIIAIAEFNKHINESLKDGSLFEEVYTSRTYLMAQKLLLVFIAIFEPLPFEEIKELALMSFFSLASIINKRSDCAVEADNIWAKYKPRFTKYLIIRKDIINDGLLKYDLNKTKLDIGNGINVPLNRKAFIEKYNTINPLGFPNCFDDFITAIKKIANSFQVQGLPKPIKAKKTYRSLTRARAVCLLLSQLHKDKLPIDLKQILNFDKGNGTMSKKKIKEFIGIRWPERENGEKQSSESIYQYMSITLNKFKTDHPEDYNYGNELFNDLIG